MGAPQTYHLFGNRTFSIINETSQDIQVPFQAILLLGLVVVVLPVLAIFAERATRLASRIQPTRFLVAICLLGFLTEVLARFLAL